MSLTCRPACMTAYCKSGVAHTHMRVVASIIQPRHATRTVGAA